MTFPSRPLKTAYPFIKYIPIVIVMSMSHLRGCATICREHFCRERYTALYKHRAAPGVAMTGNGDNDTPVQPQSAAIRSLARTKPSQAMGAVA